MSTFQPENETTAYNVTDRTNSNVLITSPGTDTVTETTGSHLSTQLTESKIKTVNGRTTISTTTKTSDTTFTSETSTERIKQNGTMTGNIMSTLSNISTQSVVTNVTSSKMSHPVTHTSSTKEKSTPNYTSTKFPLTNVSSFNSTVSNMVASTQADNSAVGVKMISDDCMQTIAIVSGLCAGLVLLNLLVSVLCFFRLRHKWRAKIQLERKKTDIWSMATYNNTIINENFSDYQLASTTNKKNRKTSRFSEDSIQFYDPFSETMSQSRFASNHDDIVMRNETLPAEARVDFSTLRRNTVSAPEELDSKLHTLRVEPDNLGFEDDRNTLRGRSSTFTVGRKNNIDRHVLLSHEELVEDQSIMDIGQTGSKYNVRTNSYHITEL